MFLTLGTKNNLFSQTEIFSFKNVWSTDQNKCFPCEFDEQHQKVYSTVTKELGVRGEFSHNFQILSVSYKNVEIPYQYQQSDIPVDPEIKVDFGTARTQNYFSIYYYPIVKVNGVIKMVDEIKIQTTSTPKSASLDRAATFASNSVLASGEWYKIGVYSTGVYKLDYSYLSSIGVNVANLNPNHLNVYGNHVAKYPTNNNKYRPDDLLKNAIYFEGNGNNVFEANEYFLFYATGPDEVIYNTADINLSTNKIDSLNTYFIKIDAAESPKRVGNQSSSVDPVTHNTSTFNDVVLHEKNDINLIKSGNNWLGEVFDIQLEYNISIALTDIDVSSPVKMKTAIASKVPSGTGAMEVYINGSMQENLSCTPFVGSYNEAMRNSNTVTYNVNTSNLSVDVIFNRTSPGSKAWLDYLMFNYRRNATLASEQILIRDLATVGGGNVTQFSVAGSNSSSFFWEVTDPSNATAIQGNLAGSTFTFTLNTDSLRSVAAFNAGQALAPIFMYKVENQDLHALPQCDYVIVTHSSLWSQAERLQNLHQNLGEVVHLVDIQDVYNEFSGGVSDPVAVRWLMKMFYDRAAGDPNLMPDHLCLFGDGTYDPLNRLPGNNYLIPTYNNDDNDIDIDYVDSYTSDDFFGILDDLEAMSPADLMDIGVGRIPVDNIVAAEQVIDKIDHYMNYGSYLYGNAEGIQCDQSGYSSSFGDWRNRLVLMADDQDNGQFVQDCEILSDSTENLYPEMNIVKIYLDAYQQVVTSGGQRYPDVEEAINQNINQGALVFNYVGHGGETGLTLERAVTINMIENWTNVNNLCIFISATCEFSRFDDPERVSAGERTLTTPYGGAVGLLTTTRLVYITVNSALVKNLYSELFKEENGQPLTLGEITRRTKNATGSSENKRNFTVLGDPALKIGKPQPLVVTDSINGVNVTMTSIDTLKALSKITVSGHIENESGSLLSNYNGIVYPTVYDKWKNKSTLGNDPDSPIKTFDIQNNIIYKGKATVANGYFTFSFVVPKDIDYSFGKGKISYYANDNSSNQFGYDTTIVVGGVDPNGVVDNDGPEVSLYMNDQNFANGGTTDESPLFIAEITDENGINTTGNGIGHDITLILDGNTADPIILNNFYEADLDTYQSGKVSYQLSDLTPGNHTLTFKVWDVNNNSSESVLEFVVIEEADLGISHLLNYPNPFTTNTDFYFEHNQCCTPLDVKIEIFTVSGKLVKTLIENVNTIAYRSEGINWDGRDEYGDKLGRGVYVYRLTVETPEGEKAEILEKLVIL
ncbi:type IX secretion system sortase PorU [Paracrocinitomix mangrovi]|uniref:type IX secretion system sortase PorU n=1 Tax=Paracrocinitomix mangrovi TaxID=2862509 RepID=UPI001C8E6873|nr:type IX secretion system sortase PorU [Paracrocinitomix mangrovi]UKN03193.1 type IX secretion system sortase PorU [Paracrocinitomix mangrovi]